MKFSVGYQLCTDDALLQTIIRYRQSISEIYFAFSDLPNGRNLSVNSQCFTETGARRRQMEQLTFLQAHGFSFQLLLNGNCYGRHALSRAFFCKIGDLIEDLSAELSLTGVTTTSPLIAKFIKQNFPQLAVRASVNMEIGTAEGLDYLAEYFDGFYIKREYNRNLTKLRELRFWCDRNGKKLYGLANSGCLNFCSARTFHDNLVAHEAEISEMDNAYAFEGQCAHYLKSNEKREDWLRITNFIRPEDVALYEGMFDEMKLATRMSADPARIIKAYCTGSYRGAVTDLLEPNHVGLFYPAVIENKKLPDAFAKTVMECDKHCAACDFCRNAQQNATVILE